MNIAIQLVTSAVTVFGIWAAGSKLWWAWLVGIGNQALWLALIVTTGAWGLLPLVVVLLVVYTRNHLRWLEERHAED
jgi:hypothetical protein